MRKIYVDSFYYIALLNPHDTMHERSKAVALTITNSHFWTSDIVLVEAMAALSMPSLRSHIVPFLRRIIQWSPDTTIVSPTPDLLGHALNTFEQHGEQGWSLTDCVSFTIMREQGITEVLTGSPSFEQAGFKPLLLWHGTDTRSKRC